MKFPSLFWILVLLAFSQCRRTYTPPEDLDETCIYETKRFPVKVIYVLKSEKGADALIVIPSSVGPSISDTILFSAAMGREISAEEAEKIDLKEGVIYTYEIKNIVSGNCTEHIEQFLPEKFTDK